MIIKKIENEDGVASVIGALMVVIIFTTSLTIFVYSYVPKWMEDNEAHHMRQVSNEFSNLKATIDTQILKAAISDGSNENDTINSISIHTPLPLGNKGIPIFASETNGNIAINSYENSFSLYNNSKTFVSSKGNIKFTSLNRFFIQQDYVYENGAIIISQKDQEFVKVPSQFEIENINGGIDVSILMVNLIGERAGLTGTNIEEVATQLSFYRKETYTLIKQSLFLNFTTQYTSAWQEFFNNSFKSEGLKINEDYSFNYENSNSVVLIINNVKKLNVEIAGIKTRLTVGWNS